MKEIELGVLLSHKVGDKGSWEATYSGMDGNTYSLTCLGSELPEPKTPAPQTTKITYAPVGKGDIDKFSENAWPAPAPKGSGLSPKDRALTPTQEDLQFERSHDEDASPELIYKGVMMNLEFGSKPTSSDENTMSLEILQGMTVKEHMTHSEWYATPSDLKKKIHPDISEQLWHEIIQVYKMVNIYNIKNPQIVLLVLRRLWATPCSG